MAILQGFCYFAASGIVMKTAALLKELHQENILTGKQAGLLTDIHLGKRFPLHYELRACLYAGVLLILAGLGMTVREHFSQLGDIAVIGLLSTCALASFVYCFAKGRAYSPGAVESPNMAFDYVLFFGCTVYSLDIAYIVALMPAMTDLWVNYLLVSSALFLFFAYRFDNRLVLSLALSSLAAWFGFKLSADFVHFREYHRLHAIAYALLVFVSGGALYRLSIKRHFLDIYLNFAALFLFTALISGTAKEGFFSLHFPSLAAACAAAAVYALRTRGFLYLLYAILAGYAGLSLVAVKALHRGGTGILFVYFIASSLAVVWLIYRMSREFRRDL